MKKYVVFWVESYLYNPTFLQKLLSYALLPFTLFYCFVIYLRYLLKTPKDFGIKVVSVGNLIVGGSGKTPVVIAIAKHFQNKKVAIILRGYGRASKGLIVVKDEGKIFVDVKQSGDEAMLYAKSLKSATVIVSEDRAEAIIKAKELGCDFVLLDDAYRYFDIQKLDIVINVKTKNQFCLPSGPFRQKLFKKDNTLIIEEGRDFQRSVQVIDATKKMVLVTAIARPQRLDPFLPEVHAKYYFEDHHEFTHLELQTIYNKEQPDSFLVTQKDFVKLKQFHFRFSILDLNIKLQPEILETITTYLA